MTNINKVDQKVGEIDYRVEILEESQVRYQGFLASEEARRVISNQEINTLRVWHDELVRAERFIPCRQIEGFLRVFKQ